MTVNTHFLVRNSRLRTPFFLSLVLLFSPFSLFAQHPLTPEQQIFLQATKDIKTGDRQQVAEAKMRLQNHPLMPYLLYQDYIHNTARTPPSAIQLFIEHYRHLTLSQRLEEHWLNHLGEQQQWEYLLQHPQPAQNRTLQCHYLRAKIEQQPDQLDEQQLQQFWLNQPYFTGVCQPLEQYLFDNKHIPGWLIWQKLDQAMSTGQIRQAKQLMNRLSTTDQRALQSWLDYHRSPQKLLTHLPNQASPFINRKIFIHALKRLANRNPTAAKTLLSQHKERYVIDSSEQQQIERIISLRLAYRYDDEAKQHLDAFNQQAGADNDTLRWQAQIALRQSDWHTLLSTISQMDNTEQQRPKWRYWMARALQMTQQETIAELILRDLAKQRHYYGFLAADSLNLAYQFRQNLNQKQPQVTDTIEKYPALKVIEQLLAVNWSTNANREWQHLIQTAAADDLAAIAQVANNWQQHNLAIRALAQGQHWDFIELRFPTPYKEPVMQNAEKNNIDAAWIYGIMRRESAFSSDARSSTGAIGLMQIMPSTAQYVGKKIGYSRQQYRNLTDAQSNIELGSAYLQYLLARYKGHLIMATAAYNAGPHRVDSWTPKDQLLPADQWIDSIPFEETRKYVKSVLEYTMVFQTLLDNRYDRLQPLMVPIGTQLQAANDQ